MRLTVKNQNAKQINIADKIVINSNNASQSESVLEFQATLDQLVQAIAALNASSILSKDDAINADKAIKLAKIESNKTSPEKNVLLNHLNNGNKILKSTTELTKRIGSAITAATQLF